MAIGVYFRPVSLNAASYDKVIGRLEAAGAGNPAGRIHHSCFGQGDKLAVFEIWDTQESFDKFGPILMPILGEVGIDPGQPTIEPVHNVIPR